VTDVDDKLTAALDEIRERVGERDALIERMKVAAVGVPEFNAAQDRLAECTPRLLAALDKVLKLTEPSDQPLVRIIRCDVIREAISRELLGKESGNDERHLA
jgi:hypothetical protein